MSVMRLTSKSAFQESSRVTEEIRTAGDTLSPALAACSYQKEDKEPGHRVGPPVALDEHSGEGGLLQRLCRPLHFQIPTSAKGRTHQNDFTMCVSSAQEESFQIIFFFHLPTGRRKKKVCMN